MNEKSISIDSVLCTLNIEYPDVFFRQGYTLVTPTTMRWSKEEFMKSDYIEKCMVFVKFNEADYGKGRKCVFIAENNEEAEAIVKFHNEYVRNNHAN